MGTLKQIRTALFNDDPSNPHSAVMSQTLRTPKEARKEVEMLRDQLSQMKDFREQQRFLGRRERILSKGWRHGIVGVDDADSDATQVFYQSQRSEKISTTQNKDLIN